MRTKRYTNLGILKRIEDIINVFIGTSPTKNPPIDADLAVYRDSTSSNALVTSTWTQIKAFLGLAITAGKTLTVPLDASVSGTNTGDNSANSLCLPLAGGTMTGDLTVPNIKGTTTNDNASAGSVGEVISASVAAASAVSLVKTEVKNVASISLPAGDWDVWGTIGFVGTASTTVSQVLGAISKVSETLPTPDTMAANSGCWDGYNFAYLINPTPIATGTVRLSLASTTTVYLVVSSWFDVSTLKAYGRIEARRAR